MTKVPPQAVELAPVGAPSPRLPPQPLDEALTEMDRHILKLALMGLCGRPGVTDQARENIRHAAQVVGVYDDALESLVALS